MLIWEIVALPGVTLCVALSLFQEFVIFDQDIEYYSKETSSSIIT